jgi:signal-transduction protein with cAMP-binding, CBS, and nucleotidyltransferase domain
MYTVAGYISNDISKLKKINESIDFIKQENLKEQQVYENKGEEEAEEEEEVDLQPLDELELSELKPTVKVENKQEDNISK